MNIPEEVSLDKDGEVVHSPLFRKLFLSLTIILVASLSFGLGRLSGVGERTPVKIEYDTSMESAFRETLETSKSTTSSISPGSASAITAVKEVNPSTSSTVVVSKNGEKYHYLHCGGAKQIKEENKILFSTPTEAEMAGYTLAANCSPR